MLAEFSVVPIGEGVSVSSHLAGIAKLIDDSGLDYRINPMGTVVEGDIDEVLALIKKCHSAMLEDVERVYTTVTIDDRKDKSGPRLDKKIASLEEKAGRKLKK